MSRRAEQSRVEQLGWYFHQGTGTGGGGQTPAVYQGLIWDRDICGGDIIVDASAGKLKGSFAAEFVPAFHAGVTFYVKSGTLTAVEIQSTTVKWSFTGDGKLCTSAVVAGRGGQVFVGSSSGNVYEIDVKSGAQKSVYNVGTDLTCGSETQAMAIAAGRLFVPVGDSLIAF